MPAADPKKDFNTETLLNEHGKDIPGLGEKLAKCYSADRYEEFQEAVEKIAFRTIDGTGREKIKSHAKETVKDVKGENSWTNLTFWLPTAISVVAIIAVVWVAYRPATETAATQQQANTPQQTFTTSSFPKQP